MKWLDLTLPTPAENLACDEALLDFSENGGGGEILRFWEPRGHFVVVGYGNRVASEVNVAACAAANVPILRRCSGGGTVLQGPGCLNYSLILRITGPAPLRSISSANRFIMERNRAALESLFRFSGFGLNQNPEPETRNSERTVAVCGHTDLAVDGRKVSGNAQRRKRRCLLFHGTFLLQFDFARVERLLPLPSKQPGYRRNRAHGDFLANLGLPAAEVKRALRRAWGAVEPLDAPPLEAVALLTRDRYETVEWNLKF